ncbi:MAG: hypothetical protein Fur0028_02250 [Bacteroidales bacterium]
MGKGDKKSRRGKIARGTYGVRRPRKTEKKYISTSKPVSKVKEVEKPVTEELVEKKAKPEKTVKAEKKEKTTEKKASPKKTTKKENKE